MNAVKCALLGLFVGLTIQAASSQILSYSAGGKNLNLGAGGAIEERADGFTMGSTAYTVTSLTLGLAFSSALTSTDFTVSLYQAPSAALSGAMNGTLVGTFVNPAFSFNSNNSATPTYTNYTFSTPGITLKANTSYWLVVQDADAGSNAVDWAGFTSGGIVGNPGGIATQIVVGGSGGSLFGDVNVISHLTSSRTSTSTGDFALFGAEAVPEPPPAALLLGGAAGLGLLAARRRLAARRG